MGQIKVTKAPIEGLYVIEPAVHGDSRGYFMETYNQRDFAEAGLDMVFVQDNQSLSSRGDAPWSSLPETASPGQAGAGGKGQRI